jgi:hypothetical protein
MNTWWQKSPYGYTSLYIGGENRACGNPDLTSSYRDTLRDQGWSFIPYWVGLQPPCSQYIHKFSNVPSTAYSQGVSSADTAIGYASALGFINSIIYFDLEPFPTNECLDATKQFVSGWDVELKNRGWVDGLFAASKGSDMAAYYGLGAPNGPTDAGIADYTYGYNSPWGLSANGVTDSMWEYDHRNHQYASDPRCEFWGGICLMVDRECGIGITAETNSVIEETSEPAGTNEGQGPGEDVAPCLN